MLLGKEGIEYAPTFRKCMPFPQKRGDRKREEYVDIRADHRGYLDDFFRRLIRLALVGHDGFCSFAIFMASCIGRVRRSSDWRVCLVLSISESVMKADVQASSRRLRMNLTQATVVSGTASTLLVLLLTVFKHRRFESSDIAVCLRPFWLAEILLLPFFCASTGCIPMLQ